MSTGALLSLGEAETVACQLAAEMRPYCERLEIAGSIRRRKPEVRDIELVAIPEWTQATGAPQGCLFGAPTERRNMLHSWALSPECPVRWIKPGTSEVIDWKPKEDGRYWRGRLASGAQLDLFLATPENFGLIYLIRTGSADFSQALVTFARRCGYVVNEGRLLRPATEWVDAHLIPTPEEQDVFAALRLEWVEPEHRTGWDALKALKALKAVTR